MEQTSELSFLNALEKTKKLGNDRLTRNGLTRAIFAEQIRFDLTQGFPLLTTKEIKVKSMIAELLWFIDAGKETGHRLSLKKLNQIQGKPDNAKNIWSHNQAPFAAKGKAQFDGDCGRIYSAQWRNWKTYKVNEGRLEKKEIDQLANVINSLKNDPFSRYHIITAWNPGELDDMCLPPCHMKMQFFVNQVGAFKYLDLAMDQRSCDMFLGVPFNISSYALLLHMVAQCVGMIAGELVITLNDCHIYMAGINEDKTLDYSKGHLDKVELQLSRPTLELSTLWLNPDITDIDSFTMNDIKIKNYNHHPFIKGDIL